MKEKVLNFLVNVENEKKLLENIWEGFKNNKKVSIMSVNPEIIINNYKNKEFVDKLNEQEYQIPDGIGITYASKINSGKIKTRITGIDFMEKIVKESIKYGGKIFLYGSKPEVAEEAKVELEKKYNGLQIVGCCDGYVEEEIAIKKINNSNANILFVGLGNPKQEQFILKNKKVLDKVKIFMPIGGSLDVLSNQIKRAPSFIQKINLEWLYRLVKQPKRIFRQIKLFKFLFVVLLKK